MSIKVNKADLEEITPGVWKKNDKTFYIQCSVLGTFHYCIKARLDKLVSKHGSLEEVGRTYISREAKKLAKEKALPTKTAINKRDEDGDSEEDSPIIERIRLPSAPKSITYSGGDQRVGEIFSANWSRCIRPALFRQNGNFCNGCRWYLMCKVEGRRWKLFEDQPLREIQMQFYSMDVYTESESIERS